jgi:ATP-binding cassette subfamily F protein 3
MLVEAMNIYKNYGGNPVLEGVDFSIAEGEKVGLIGRNGAGKSTLLRILCGGDDDFSGTCRRMPGRRIVLVPQYAEDFSGTAVEYIAAEALETRRRLGELEQAMSDQASGASLAATLQDYGALRERYDLSEGDGAEERAERFLEMLGLPGMAERPVSVLSGGERNILALARALNAKPDLLILDEPGNHLDVWGLAWLESFLKGIPQAVLIVSHNRYLLDRVVQRTVELENGKALSYAGGWSAYRMEKLRKNASQGMEWKADQKKLSRLEELVKRFEQIARSRPDPAWGRRLRARKTQLKKAQEDAAEKPVEEGASLGIQFRKDTSKADIAVSVEGYAKVLPDGRTLFKDADLLVRSGERVALIGPNGSGKTTFLTDLVSLGAWDDPVLRIGPSFILGWCAQHQEVFDHARSIKEEFLRLGSFTEDDIFTVLRRFLFTRADMDKLIGQLSGGERNRLQLARVVLLKADLLILDEPTNHLDIPAREAVEEALADFKGTVILVSHDRYFLDTVAERVVEIDSEGGFTSWEGNFSEFWYRAYGIQGARVSSAAPAAKPAVGRPAKLEDRGRQIQRNKEAPGKSAPKPASRSSASSKSGAAAVGDLEARILALEKERTQLEQRSAQALSAGNYKESRRLGNDLAELTSRIEKLYGEWED